MLGFSLTRKLYLNHHDQPLNTRHSIEMITFTQIKLRGMCMLNEESIKRLAKVYIDAGDLGVNVLNSFYAYDAFLVITDMDDINPANAEELMAFEGFLNVEMNLNGEELIIAAWPIYDVLCTRHIITVEELARILNEPVSRCNEEYLSRNPSIQEIEIYQSLFTCGEPNKAVYVDFGKLRSMLSETDMSNFSQLLTTYLANTTHEEGQACGSVICGLMQGLVAEYPNTKLVDLCLGENDSMKFIRYVKYESMNQTLGAGYSVAQAWQNWGTVRELITKFFVANGFLVEAD